MIGYKMPSNVQTTMRSDLNSSYWASLIHQVRLAHNFSQEDFAAAVFSNQATVSRWEKGLVIPSYDKQSKIEKLASQANIASLGGIVEVVRSSPHRMILVDKNNFIIAASSSSEWMDNMTVSEQLSHVAQKPFEELVLKLKDLNFWIDQGGKRLDFNFNDGLKTWNSVIVAVAIRGIVYAVVQQTVT